MNRLLACPAHIAALALAAFADPAAAQSSSGQQAVEATAAIEAAGPAIAITQSRQVVLGSVFAAREDRLSCVYALNADGTTSVSTVGTTGVNPLTAGCAFTGDVAPVPGQLAVQCTPGAQVQFGQSGGRQIAPLSFSLVPARVRFDESDPGRESPGGTASQFTCPAGGTFLIDLGAAVQVGTGGDQPLQERWTIGISVITQ